MFSWHKRSVFSNISISDPDWTSLTFSRKMEATARRSENPPDAQKGRAKPPMSKRKPPIVGPNMEPIPLKDSAREVALPCSQTGGQVRHFSILSCPD